MTDFFTACATNVLVIFDITVTSVGVLFILIVILGLVSAVPTAKLVLAKFATAPPHFATVRAIMSSAAPLEVFFFIVLSATIFASLHPGIEFTFALDELLNSNFRFLLVHVKLLTGLLKCQNFFKMIIVLLIDLGDLLLKLCLPILEIELVVCVLLLDGFFTL